MKYAWIASHLDSFDLKLMCNVLSVKKSSYFSWVQLDHLARERTAHETDKSVEDAFLCLKENAGERGIKGYLLHEKNKTNYQCSNHNTESAQVSRRNAP